MATSVLRDQQYMFGVRSLLAAEKALLIRNDRPGRDVVATTNTTIAACQGYVPLTLDVMRVAFKVPLAFHTPL